MADPARKSRRIYLCASFCRRGEMKRLAGRLRRRGHVVTSRWINQECEKREFEKKHPIEHANDDLVDIEASDTLVYFPGYTRRGGKDTEFGYSLNFAIDRFVVGERRNIFQWFAEPVKGVEELIPLLEKKNRPVI